MEKPMTPEQALKIAEQLTGPLSVRLRDGLAQDYQIPARMLHIHKISFDLEADFKDNPEDTKLSIKLSFWQANADGTKSATLWKGGLRYDWDQSVISIERLNLKK